jgi:hypothetical protein
MKPGHKNISGKTRICNYISSFFQKYYAVEHINIIAHEIWYTVGEYKNVNYNM